MQYMSTVHQKEMIAEAEKQKREWAHPNKQKRDKKDSKTVSSKRTFKQVERQKEQ